MANTRSLSAADNMQTNAFASPYLSASADAGIARRMDAKHSPPFFFRGWSSVLCRFFVAMSVRSIFTPSFFPSYPTPCRSTYTHQATMATSNSSSRFRQGAGMGSPLSRRPKAGGKGKVSEDDGALREAEGREGGREGGKGVLSMYTQIRFDSDSLYRAWTRRSWRRFVRRLTCLTPTGK